MQSIDSLEKYAYGMNKDIVCKKKKLNAYNIIKNKKCLTLVILPKNT